MEDGSPSSPTDGLAPDAGLEFAHKERVGKPIAMGEDEETARTALAAYRDWRSILAPGWLAR